MNSVVHSNRHYFNPYPVSGGITICFSFHILLHISSMLSQVWLSPYPVSECNDCGLIIALSFLLLVTPLSVYHTIAELLTVCLNPELVLLNIMFFFLYCYISFIPTSAVRIDIVSTDIHVKLFCYCVYWIFFVHWSFSSWSLK